MSGEDAEEVLPILLANEKLWPDGEAVTAKLIVGGGR